MLLSQQCCVPCCCIVVLLWRIHDEEALMRQEFGADWGAYAKKSWHLIPYIY
jgi:protein-S-isoprenylcysteine O-methyltransferase Ste14